MWLTFNLIILKNKKFKWKRKENNYNYQRFSVKSKNTSYDIQLSLLGDYQIINTLTALGVTDCLRGSFSLNENDIIESLKNVKWPGRLEIVNKEPTVILDGSHNEEGIQKWRLLHDNDRSTKERSECWPEVIWKMLCCLV